jgi:hypothetical protein
MSKVKVTNMSTGKIMYPVFNKPGIKRIFPKHGSFIMIDEEEMEETIYQPGVRELFAEGYLKIDSDELLIKIGLEEMVGQNILDLTSAKALLETRNSGEIRKALKDGTPSSRGQLVAAAQEMKFMDPTINKWFIEYCGVDIIQTIVLLGDDEK